MKKNNLLREQQHIFYLIEMEDEASPAIQFISIADLKKDDEKFDTSPFDIAATLLGVPVDELSYSDSQTFPDTLDVIAKIKEMGVPAEEQKEEDKVSVGPMLFTFSEVLVCIDEVKDEDGNPVNSSLYLKTSDVPAFNEALNPTSKEEEGGKKKEETPAEEKKEEEPTE